MPILHRRDREGFVGPAAVTQPPASSTGRTQPGLRIDAEVREDGLASGDSCSARDIFTPLTSLRPWRPGPELSWP